MKLRSLIIVFVMLWLGSAWLIPIIAGDLERAGNFGDSFGGVSALFSGLALALAIYSMVLQQKQAAEFEKVTVASLDQQSRAIDLIEKSLAAQANAAKVVALTSLIEHEEQRIDTLRHWGGIAGDENKYVNGIKAAEKRIEHYKTQLKQHADG